MKMRLLSRKLRATRRVTRPRAWFAAALLAGGVLGPLAGIAVGAAGTTTTETITLPAGCTTAVKTTPTTSTTSTTGGTGLGATTTTVTYTTTTTATVTVPVTTVQTITTGTTTTTTTVTGYTTTTTTGTQTNPVTLTSTTPTTPTVTGTTPTATSTTPTCTSSTTTKVAVPPYVPPTNTAAAPAVIKPPVHNPLAGHAMWIWLMSATDGGNLTRIIAQAKLDGIGTLIIKNGDGRTAWSQFNPSLVREIHAAGLKVCAWQYIHGNYPLQ